MPTGRSVLRPDEPGVQVSFTVIYQNVLSAALGADVTLMQTAGEGGAWGIALLASYMANRAAGEKLKDFLSKRVFADMKGNTVSIKKME